MAERMFERKEFFGGIADNPHFLGRGEFVDGQNINISGQVPLVRTAQKADVTKSTGSKEMYCYVQPAYNYLYGFGESGKIYRLSSTPSSNVATLTGGGDIVGARIYNGFIRWVEDGTSPKIGRLPIDNHTGTWSSFRTEDYFASGDRTSYRVNPTDYGCPSVHFNGDLFFANEKRVFRIDNQSTCFLQIDTLPARVVNMSVHGQRIRIYLEDGQVLFYDGIDSRDEGTHAGLGILAVTATANGDYIIGGQNSSRNAELFGVFEGYGFRTIKSAEHTGAYFDLKGKCAQFQMAESDGTVYIAGTTYRNGIYTSGKSIPGLPDFFNYEFHTASTGYAYSSIYSVYVFSRNLVISYEDTNGTTQVDIISINARSSSRQDDGSIVLSNFDGGERKIRKRLTRVEVIGSYDASNTIEVQYRKDIATLHRGSRRYILQQSPSRSSLFTLSLGDPKEYKVSTGVDVRFYDIQFKLVLTGSTVSLLNFVIYYDEVVDA